jgi:hypothetical protein
MRTISQRNADGYYRIYSLRRCAESRPDGRFVLEQETNAYAVLPESQWRGYRPPAEPAAASWPDTRGGQRRPGGAGGRSGGQGASDPKDGLAAALARLGQAFMARNA